MLSLSAFWLQGLLIVIVPQPFFTQSNVNRHDNKFCLIVTVFLGKGLAFMSSKVKEMKLTKVDPDCSALANELLQGNISLKTLTGK